MLFIALSVFIRIFIYCKLYYLFIGFLRSSSFGSFLGVILNKFWILLSEITDYLYNVWLHLLHNATYFYLLANPHWERIFLKRNPIRNGLEVQPWLHYIIPVFILIYERVTSSRTSTRIVFMRYKWCYDPYKGIQRLLHKNS